MVFKTEYGKHILTAGEISSYSVCPEAWYLKEVKKVDSIYVDRIKKGQELHKEWATDVSEATYFTRGTKTILLLICLAILAFLITR